MNERRRRVISSVLVTMLLLVGSAVENAEATAGAEQIPSGEVVARIQATLARMSEYEFGDGREALSELRELVKAAAESPMLASRVEQEMIPFLASDASFAGKQFVCEQLSLIGTSSSVPVLMDLLADAETADIALFALQRIPDPAVGTALRGFLRDAAPATKIAIVNTLGERREAGAAGDLGRLLTDPDPAVARSAATALGKIGGAEATRSLERARERTTGEVRDAVLDAYLHCADRLLAEGSSSRAASIYRDVYDGEDARNLRAAALRGLVMADPANAAETIVSSLRRDNRALQAVAAGLVRELPNNADVSGIIARIPDLAPPAQVQLLSAFAERDEATAYPAALAAVRHHDESVRIAAIAALSVLGGESDVALLSGLAVSGPTPADQEAARAALGFLPGASVNRAIMTQISAADPAVRAELVRALGERNATEATDVLMGTASDADPLVRLESQRSLAIVTAPDRIDELLDLLIAEPDSAVRNEAERTVVFVARKAPEDTGRAEPVLAAFSTVADGDARGSLIEVLGRIGDPAALPAIRAELEGTNTDYKQAAIAALGSWPDPGPAPELLNVARTASDKTTEVLALRAYIDLLRIRSERPVDESIGLFEGAMELATETSEKRMVLAGLGDLRSADAMNATVGYLDDPELKLEAEAALRNLLDRVRDADDEEAKRLLDAGLRETLTKIVDVAENEQLKEWAQEMLERGS